MSKNDLNGRMGLFELMFCHLRVTSDQKQVKNVLIQQNRGHTPAGQKEHVPVHRREKVAPLAITLAHDMNQMISD